MSVKGFFFLLDFSLFLLLIFHFLSSQSLIFFNDAPLFYYSLLQDAAYIIITTNDISQLYSFLDFVFVDSVPLKKSDCENFVLFPIYLFSQGRYQRVEIGLCVDRSFLS